MTNALGDYLRARRDLVQPEDVGIVAGARRRVPGLRREELAMLAGISSDYYLRLEQGRDQHPSDQVLDALADALRLDATATAHLHSLARPRMRRRARKTERVPAGILALLEQLPMPAYVTGRVLDVLAANGTAVALSPMLTPGRNVLRELLLDPAARAMHVDWDTATRSLVGHLPERADPDDPQLAALVGELSLRSDQFRKLWARADVGHPRSIVRHLRHPQVGDLHLRMEKLNVDHTDGQQLVIQHAEPGSESAQALALLGSVSVTP
ncbi:helix-turn-helix transcriptional regulator [Fodinicola acaciae]|uniref:helix-turn-helix transcriptional regulator n=1 Tax=Fodinicola acaciae TaxID=2681555 RepID=UPI0013D40773|nr:helix-turn-helix transcriptional regulator [Fodinicola acaciae]